MTIYVEPLVEQINQPVVPVEAHEQLVATTSEIHLETLPVEHREWCPFCCEDVNAEPGMPSQIISCSTCWDMVGERAFDVAHLACGHDVVIEELS